MIKTINKIILMFFIIGKGESTMTLKDLEIGKTSAVVSVGGSGAL